MIDIDSEIQQANKTLHAAESAFQKHAPKFNNNEEEVTKNMSLAEKYERDRKLSTIDNQTASSQPQRPPQQPAQPQQKDNANVYKWNRALAEEPQQNKECKNCRRTRINSLLADMPPIKPSTDEKSLSRKNSTQL